MSSLLNKAKDVLTHREKPQQTPNQSTNGHKTSPPTATPASAPSTNIAATTTMNGTNGTNGTHASAGKLAGRVALITGGTKGIGRATTIALVKLGAQVVVNYSSDEKSAQALVAELGSNNVFPVKGDAGDINSIEQLVKIVADRFGKIDILIPNAGMLPMKTLEATTEADFDTAYKLNVKGPYFLAQKAIPFMSKGSTIIFLSTSLCAASIITPPYCLYASTKGAIEQIVRASSKDLASKGIRVNAIAPGPTGTEFFLKGKPEQLVKTIEGFSPYNKLGQPDEIADVLAFLSSDDARWLVGQVVRVNGAMTVG